MVRFSISILSSLAYVDRLCVVSRLSVSRSYSIDWPVPCVLHKNMAERIWLKQGRDGLRSQALGSACAGTCDG